MSNNKIDTMFTLGVEEEFFLIDPQSRDLLIDPDENIFDFCIKESGPHKFVHELLRFQIEANTRICGSVSEVRTALQETRRIVIKAAEKYGAAVMAASCHPFAVWRVDAPTNQDRYTLFASLFQETVRRFLVGGMHVHIGFGDPDQRVRIMTAMRRYLPLLLALSGSSPFNAGHQTGFKSWRISIVGNLPRSGIPRPFGSWAEYNRFVADHQRMKFITDSSELWWDIRPSNNFPTVEMRICDVCTRIEEAVSIVALYACLVLWLLRQDKDRTLPAEPHTELIYEDRWLAQRFGVHAFLGDWKREVGRVDIQEYTHALIEILSPLAREMECESELNNIHSIILNGASADRQSDLYRLCRLDGSSHEEALVQVADHLITETKEGLDLT